MMLGASSFLLLVLAAQVPSTRGGRITGAVTDAATGASITGARVSLMLVIDTPEGSFGRRPLQSLTDANGAFAFDGVEPGQYILRIERTGFAPYPDVFGEGPSERLTVGANGTDPQLRIALKKGAVVAGRILNAAGEPEPNLQVSALKRTDKAGPLGFAQVGGGQTNDIGEFRIASLPSGEYRILATAHTYDPFETIHTGATTLAPTFFPGTLDQNTARVLTLTSGQAVTDLEFTIATVAAFRVSGVVTDQARHPSPRAMVTLIPEMRMSAAFTPMMAVASDDGTFEIGGVVPGTYRINAEVSQGNADGTFVGGSFEIIADDGAPSEPGTFTVGAADVIGLAVIARERSRGR